MTSLRSGSQESPLGRHELGITVLMKEVATMVADSVGTLQTEPLVVIQG